MAVNPVDDEYEREAESIAEEIVGPDGHGTTRAATARSDSSGAIGRAGKSPVASGGGPDVSSVVHDGVSSGGMPLDRNVREFMEGRFGHDFANIRVHTDGPASRSADALEARAYTVRSDIVFAKGEYDPASRAGRRLLAHELTHTIQQTGGVSRDPATATPKSDRTLLIEAFDANVKEGKLSEAAVRLNGFNDEDIDWLLKKLTPLQRRSMYYASPKWVWRVTKPIAAMDPSVAESATVTDAQLDQVQKKHAGGVTVALYANYDYGGAAEKSNNAAFPAEATTFAANEEAVAASGNAVSLGVPIAIDDVSQVVVVVQRIHLALVDKWRQSQKSAAEGAAAPTAAPAADPPAFTRVRNLALFAHGMPFGIGMDKKNAFTLHREKGLNPSNVKSFVSGLTGAVAPDVRVQLFACNAALGQNDPQEWLKPTQGERKGGDSFAAELAAELGPEASVYAHTAAAHTTELTSARVFGKDAGGGGGGVHIFDLLYDEAFIQAELHRLFPDSKDVAPMHDPLRAEMWLHYQSSMYNFVKVPVVGADGQPAKNADGTPKTRTQGVPKTYAKGEHPLGHEQFGEIEQAKTKLHKDWTDTWIKDADHLARVKPATPAAAVQRSPKRVARREAVVQRDPATFKDFIGEKVAEARTKIVANDCGGALAALNGLWIRDALNALQQLAKTGDLDKLIANFDSAPAFVQPRMGLAINAVKPFPRGVEKASAFEAQQATGTPEEQARFRQLQQEFAFQRTEVEAFQDVRKWPELLTHAGKPASATDKKKQDVIVDYVVRNRKMVGVNVGLALANWGGRPNAGYFYNGAPAKDPAPNITNPDARREHANRVVWQEVAGEGSSASINTYDGGNATAAKDRANLTWGRGFLSAGQLGEKMAFVFQRDPAVRDILLDGGFTYRSGTWLAVDTASGTVKEGQAALELIRFDKEVLSLLIQVGEDPAHSQNIVNAEADTVARHAGAVPDSVLDQNWSDESIAFAAHCVHWGSNWSAFAGTGGSIPKMIRIMARGVPRDDSDPGGATVTQSSATNTFLAFARLGTAVGAIQRNHLVTGPAALPNDLRATPTGYAGHVFLATGAGTFFHLAP